MVVAVTCCCWEIKKCVKITAIVGMMSSILSFSAAVYTCIQMTALSFFTMFYIPISASLFVAYVLVLVGLKKESSKYLSISQIIFGSTVLLNFALSGGLLIIGFNMSQASYETDKGLTTLFFVSAVLILILIVFTISTIAVVQKVRNLIIEEFAEANLTPEEPCNHITFGGRGGFSSNVYSADPNYISSQQNQYISPSQMTEADYININASATYYRR